jgi:hypothetical protein
MNKQTQSIMAANMGFANSNGLETKEKKDKTSKYFIAGLIIIGAIIVLNKLK